MKGWLKHPIRVAGRLLWLAFEIALASITFLLLRVLRVRKPGVIDRAFWLHYTCGRCLRIFGIRPSISGPVPSRGLLVCNHLSYLDILVLSACAPAVFVAKIEVKSWPIFGWFARLAGTVFVHREKRAEAARAKGELEQALHSTALVVLFPEGTSSNGKTVLPFKSALLQPATHGNCPVYSGFIRYELDDGDVGEEVCYWKDMTLLPHLVNLLSKQAPRASIRFAEFTHAITDRKELARLLRSEVSRLGFSNQSYGPRLLQTSPAVLSTEQLAANNELAMACVM